MSADGLLGFGTPRSRLLFDGDFYRSVTPPLAGTPVTSLVFVQSRSGNTVAKLPSLLGGGETDLHLIYEGLSRIDADAILAGAASARGRDLVFSIWHPDFVRLRLARGRSRHPVQVIVTNRGELRFDDALMFNEPDLPVLVVTRSAMVDTVRRRLGARPWVDVVDAGEPVSFTRALRALRERGIEVVSCIGGRITATALLSEGLITDVYLTTSAIEAGEPNTPYYEGGPLALRRVLLKEGRGVEAGVRFEHFLVGAPSRPVRE